MNWPKNWDMMPGLAPTPMRNMWPLSWWMNFAGNVDLQGPLCRGTVANIMDKLMITVAPVGAEATRRDNPNLPLTPEEIAEEAVRCEAKGASIIHLHVRDSNGHPTQDKETFRQVIGQVKKRSNLIIQTSTGGASWMTGAERMQPLELRP